MEVAIVGGGITGLTTALALLKKGINCKVYERSTELNEVGAGIWMQPNAMKVLDYLDIGESVRKAGMQLEEVEITNSKLVPLKKRGGKFVVDSSNNKITSIHRARLQRLLFDALPKGTVELGRSYVQHQTYKDKIKIEFTTGTAEADILLGADGINSLIRKNEFRSELRYSGQTCWRGISQIKLPKNVLANGNEMWGNNIRFGFANISPKEVYWFAVVKAPKDEKDDPNLRKNDLLKRYRDFHPLCARIIQGTEEDRIIRNDINDLKRLDQWHTDKLCLLGDAAHATTPNMGQGAGQGVEDAYYIGKFLSNQLPEEAFRDFDKSRRKKVDYVVNNSWIFGKMAHSTWGRLSMKLIMKLTPERVLLKQLETLYSVDQLV